MVQENHACLHWPAITLRSWAPSHCQYSPWDNTCAAVFWTLSNCDPHLVLTWHGLLYCAACGFEDLWDAPWFLTTLNSSSRREKILNTRMASSLLMRGLRSISPVSWGRASVGILTPQNVQQSRGCQLQFLQYVSFSMLPTFLLPGFYENIL